MDIPLDLGGGSLLGGQLGHKVLTLNADLIEALGSFLLLLGGSIGGGLRLICCVLILLRLGFGLIAHRVGNVLQRLELLNALIGILPDQIVGTGKLRGLVECIATKKILGARDHARTIAVEHSRDLPQVLLGLIHFLGSIIGCLVGVNGFVQRVLQLCLGLDLGCLCIGALVAKIVVFGGQLGQLNFDVTQAVRCSLLSSFRILKRLVV